MVKTFDSINPMCNALCFPYCVPKKSKLRLPDVDPLNVSLTTKKLDTDEVNSDKDDSNESDNKL